MKRKSSEFDAESGWRLYYKDRPTTLYYLEFKVDKKRYYKIGITTTSIEKRFASEKYPYKILWQKTYASGKTAYTKEQKILKKYNRFRYTEYDILKSGNSELFTKNVLKGKI